VCAIISWAARQHFIFRLIQSNHTKETHNLAYGPVLCWKEPATYYIWLRDNTKELWCPGERNDQSYTAIISVESTIEQRGCW